MHIKIFFFLLLYLTISSASSSGPDIPEKNSESVTNSEWEEETEAAEIVERVLIHLNNIPIGNQALPGSGGLVKLERRRLRQEAQTLDNMASFYDIPARQGYTISGFHRSKSEAFGQPLELWGIWSNIHIHPDQNEFTLIRKMPYVSDIHTSYKRENIANPSLQKGDDITFDVIMHNPAKTDYKGNLVILLKNSNTGNVTQIEKPVSFYASNNREHLNFSYTTTEAGEFYFAAGIFIKQRINQWTDVWDWSTDPLFFVSKEHRRIEFAGYQWDVKAGFGNPGSNNWSNSPDDVFVDDRQRLHLTLSKKENGRWYASEVISRQTFGYGTYTFYIDADPASYDPHVVAGIFLYRNEQNEIDIEFSRWGDQENYQFGNYVIQPAEYPGNQFRFPFLASGTHTTHRISWQPDKVLFSSWHGHYPEPIEERIIAQWQYEGKHVPTPNGLKLFFNLWLFQGITPKAEKTEKLIISHFEFQPMESPTEQPEQ